MEVNVLREITTQISGRKIDPFLEDHLPQYAPEVTALLTVVQDVSRRFPVHLEPVPVFAPKKADYSG
jgi:hypothetical protein